MLNYTITNNQYSNIKEVLRDYFQISNRLLIKLKKENRIYLNRKPAYVNSLISINDIVSADIDFEEESLNIVPVKIDLNIVYEDDYLLIINKPAGIPVHPSISHFEDSLSNGIRFYFNCKNIKRKIRPVNRLDKDTSGIVVLAKNEYIQECLIQQMKNKAFIKQYIAILDGFLENKSGTIHANISRKENSIIEREISINGDIAITHYYLLKSFKTPDNTKLSLVNFQLETGRTHQIRIHSKYIGHPILGDFLYGKESNLISRQALHAFKISFIHPITKENLNFEIDLPNDMKKIIK